MAVNQNSFKGLQGLILSEIKVRRIYESMIRSPNRHRGDKYIKIRDFKKSLDENTKKQKIIAKSLGISDELLFRFKVQLRQNPNTDLMKTIQQKRLKVKLLNEDIRQHGYLGPDPRTALKNDILALMG